MTSFQRDMQQVRALAEDAVSTAILLGAWTSEKELPPDKLQSLLERVSDEMEHATVTVRNLCERHCPGTGGYGKRPVFPAREIAGSVGKIGYAWLHMELYTPLPHCRYRAPLWLSDTIRRLLDAYETEGGTVPYFKDHVALIIDEHSNMDGRHIYDQDNKGWKAVSNALKGRVFPDDDQYSLAVILLSSRSNENMTHLTVMDLCDVGDFMNLRTSRHAPYSVYDGV